MAHTYGKMTNMAKVKVCRKKVELQGKNLRYMYYREGQLATKTLLPWLSFVPFACYGVYILNIIVEFLNSCQ